QTLAALTQGSSARRAPASGEAANTAPARSGPTSADLLGGEVKITSDNATNSLVIQASPRDFEVLKGIIQRLDVRRKQVFIEGVILEASVNNDSTFGMNVTGPFGRTGFLGGQDSNDNDVKSGGIFSVGQGKLSLESLLRDPFSIT